ncbi:uncharacterized protein MELLADRAFT_69915 [Melampsora larici-populina 98AG31]|uniref:Uncharacterized protein n=1 Tax=Melampsora larici-populina (strain 98AG31 / pathotype 3-4-7) TaxID=747676 RepID=F4SCS7_MELLP|nr:uncharacterized protein MELLADRAFT_69915 [Melampsora larici-populina 98AG31]EGF97552.1 hypothetical protein MELLADRAFT_69915 [Melampsora larici-populina 98AG31]
MERIDLYQTLGFGPRAIHIDASEDLGWSLRALPFHPLQNTETDLVFVVVPHIGSESQSDVLDYKWACKHVFVDVEQTQHLSYWDGRTTHPAILKPGSDDIIVLNACALHSRHETLEHYLHFTQVYLHAACLLDKFKIILEEQICFSPKQDEHMKNLRVWSLSSVFEISKNRLLYYRLTSPLIEYHGRHAVICGFRGFGDVITNLTIMDDT